jgi:hypothetical protein
MKTAKIETKMEHLTELTVETANPTRGGREE